MMPFPGDISATPNGTLLLAAFFAFFYLLMQAREPSWRRTVAKTAPMLLLAGLSATQGGPWLLTAALLASAAGDAALAQDGERPFLAGLASFLLAHVLYIALFVLHWRPELGLLAAEPWRALAGVALVALCAIMLWRLLPAMPGGMRAPVGAYVATILLMGLASLGVPGGGVALGAILFILSDAILASQKFLLSEDSPHRAWAGPAVWILYCAAQFLITLAFLL